MKLLTLSVLAGASLATFTLQAAAEGPRGERPAFETLDADGNGALTQAEVQQGIEAQAAIRFAAADTDGDGTLSRTELLAQGEARREGRLDRMIARLDTDGDGAISPAELANRGQGRNGKDRMGRMFERADADGDGALSAQEWDDVRFRRGRR
ncbi:MAG: EF-hand domain-containing protein [Pseudomonadota bacterium]